jgi:hypothetical protein
VKHLIRAFVVLSISGLLVASGTLAGQARAALGRKYGKPISETFIVRPGISATATYGRSGRIIEWLISPRNTALIKSRGRTLSQESVKTVIDELVPPSVRGKPLMGSVLNATCMPENDCNGTAQVYENVTIYFNAGKAGLSYVVVQWKK